MERREYETRDAVPLTTVHIAWLRTADVTVVPSMTVSGTFQVTAGSTVGVLRVDGSLFSVRPKVGIRRLLFLLSYFPTQDWLQPWLADVDDDHDSLDAMARIFARPASPSRGSITTTRSPCCLPA